MFKTEKQRAAAITNAQRWLATRAPHESAHLNELIRAESNWQHDAESGTGARGVSQFIRGTWQDTVKFARKNIPQSELPPGLNYDALESYETMWSRPLASTFMAWANAKRIEATALRSVNRKRVRAGLPNATDLMDAFGNDPRKWSTVVAVGHKDGASRTGWFIGEDGSFDTTEARKNYRERYDRFQSEADQFTKEARAAEAKGDSRTANSLFKKARARRNNDSTGHVFGYADRISGVVSNSLGLEPLEYSPEEINDFLALSVPTHTDNNPSRRGFINRIETGVGLLAQETPAAPTDSGTTVEQQVASQGPDSGFNLLDAIIPSASAADQLPPGEVRLINPNESGGDDIEAQVRANVARENTPSARGPTTVAENRAEQVGQRVREFGSSVTDAFGNIINRSNQGIELGRELLADGVGNVVSTIGEALDRERLAEAERDVAFASENLNTGDGPVLDFITGLTGGSVEANAQQRLAQAQADLLSLQRQMQPTERGALGPEPELPAGVIPDDGLRTSALPQQQGQAPLDAGQEFSDALLRARQAFAEEEAFNLRALELQDLAANRAQQLIDQEASLAALGLLPDANFQQFNPQALAPSGDPFAFTDNTVQNFSPNITPLGTGSPNVGAIGRSVRVLDEMNQGNFFAQGQQDALGVLSQTDPLRAQQIANDQAVGLNPFYELQLAQATQQLGQAGVQERQNLGLEQRVLALTNQLGLPTTDSGLRREINEIASSHLGDRRNTFRLESRL